MKNIKVLAWIAIISAISLSAVAQNVREEWRKPFDAVYVQLGKNLRAPNHVNPFFHAHPGRLYPGVYLWDSSFISLIWKDKNPLVAQDIIRSVLYRQQPDGRVPQVVGPLGPNNNGLSNPPVISYAAVRIARETKDMSFVKSVYAGLKRYHQWIWRSRRLKNGLFFWKKPYESGIDNSPRYSNRDESKIIDTSQTAASDFSAYAVLDSESLAELAMMQVDALPTKSDEAKRLRADSAAFTSQASEIAQLMRSYLWNEEDGYFYDRNTINGEFVRIPTVSSLIPLLAGVPTQAQWLRLRAHITNPNEFYTAIPIPSVSRNSRFFEKDCWRGPVWINTAYMVIMGVKRYGDGPLTRDLSEKLVNGVYKTWENTGKFVEYYDPDAYDFKNLTRKKGLGFLGLSASPKPLTVITQLITKRLILGPKPVGHFVGWTGLANTLVIDELQAKSAP